MNSKTLSYIYGKHAVEEALRYAPQHVRSVLLARRDSDNTIRALARQADIRVEPFQEKTPPRELERDAVHQGVIALVDTSKLTQSYTDFMNGCSVNEHTALVLLGELHDPQNVGAIIRSAAAFGAAGVLFPEHRQVGVTGRVVKASAGTAFRIPLVTVGNANTTLRDLKDKGFWIYGLDASGTPLSKETFDAPAVFVIGNEGEGMREKTMTTCDIVLSVPMHERCESLNASASAAVALYAWSSQHPPVLE